MTVAPWLPTQAADTCPRLWCWLALLVMACLGSATAAVHTGAGDASTALALDADYMLVGDDEDQFLRLYARRLNGPPILRRNFTGDLALTDRDPAGILREVDIEASARLGRRTFWLGSHSNCGGCDPLGEARPNRHRLFAADVMGSVTNLALTYVGRYDLLRRDLIDWDTRNLHGRGARYYGLAASAAEGVPPEAVGRHGFNLEGLAVTPDGTTAYLGFRAPLVPTTNRTRALIVPLLNLPQLVLGNPARGPAVFGLPIELNLLGRGVRSLEVFGNGLLIVAGSVSNAGGGRIFTWDGHLDHPAREHLANLTLAEPEGVMLDGPPEVGSRLQIIGEGTATASVSEFVALGPAIPDLLKPAWVAPEKFAFSVLGRAGASYDLETSDDGQTWRALRRLQLPVSGELRWTNSALSLPHQMFRVRFTGVY